MTFEPPSIIDDPELQADVLRASHALAVAFLNREPEELQQRLVHELAGMHPYALTCALIHAHVSLRITLDATERIRPGFRQTVLRAIGAGLASGP